MGNNTVALFLNDCSGDYQRNADRVVATIEECLRGGRGEPHGPVQMQILPSVHADGLQIIAAGANSIRLIGLAHWQNDDVEAIRAVADNLGYRLVRKRQPASSEQF